MAIQFFKLLKELQLTTASWYRPFSKPYNSTSDCWPQMQPIWIKLKKKNEKKTPILLCAYAYSFDFTIFNVRKNLVRFLDATWCIGSSAIEDSNIKYDLILVLSYSHGISSIIIGFYRVRIFITRIWFFFNNSQGKNPFLYYIH